MYSDDISSPVHKTSMTFCYFSSFIFLTTMTVGQWQNDKQRPLPHGHLQKSLFISQTYIRQSSPALSLVQNNLTQWVWLLKHKLQSDTQRTIHQPIQYTDIMTMYQYEYTIILLTRKEIRALVVAPIWLANNKHTSIQYQSTIQTQLFTFLTWYSRLQLITHPLTIQIMLFSITKHCITRKGKCFQCTLFSLFFKTKNVFDIKLIQVNHNYTPDNIQYHHRSMVGYITPAMVAA